MKRTALSAIVIASLLSAAAIAGPGGPRGPGNPEQHLQRLEQALDLNAEQVGEVRQILETRHEKAEAIRDRYESPDRRQMRGEMQALRDQTHAELANVLTGEQMRKLETLKSERKRRYSGKE